MVSAIGAFSNMYAGMTRINAINNMYSNNNAMTQNISAASRQAVSFGSQPLRDVQQRGQNLMASNINNKLAYQIAMQLEKNQTTKKKLNYMA